MFFKNIFSRSDVKSEPTLHVGIHSRVEPSLGPASISSTSKKDLPPGAVDEILKAHVVKKYICNELLPASNKHISQLFNKIMKDDSIDHSVQGRVGEFKFKAQYARFTARNMVDVLDQELLSLVSLMGSFAEVIEWDSEYAMVELSGIEIAAEINRPALV